MLRVEYSRTGVRFPPTPPKKRRPAAGRAFFFGKRRAGIESIEMQNKNFVVGVQWHPEMLALKDDTMLNLFIKFINSCNTK